MIIPFKRYQRSEKEWCLISFLYPNCKDLSLRLYQAYSMTEKGYTDKRRAKPLRDIEYRFPRYFEERIFTCYNRKGDWK